MHVSELHVFPVKSMAGFSPANAYLAPWGLENDRRWMLVGRDGSFITQREAPRMALLRPAPTAWGLTLTAPEMPPVDARADGPAIQARVWRDTVLAATCAPDVDAWLTEALGLPCRLVYLDDPGRRQLKQAWRLAQETVSFADGFPVLLASLASLDDLNARLAEPIRINRFRANIVVAGAPAWAEDTWRTLRIGEALLRVAKPCDRCLITTIEQETATRPDKREPLRTLASFRRDADGVNFGQNLVPLVPGRIAAGDPIEVLEAGPPNLTLLTDN